MSHAQPGVRFDRRLALHGALAAPALGLLGRAAAGPRRMDVQDLLARWTDETARFVEDGAPNEDRFLHRLCADLAALEGAPFPERKAVSYQGDGTRSGPVHAAMPFLVLQFDLEPGAVIRAHNHIGWSFLSLGVQGEATVRHYEPLPGAPEPDVLDEEFELREVQSALLRPGVTSSLTRTRANIHGFRAGDQGARFLDFGVHVKEPGAGPKTFSVLDVDEEASDVTRRIHRARWIGNIYKK